ncbi:M35 family metallo-endopeptidase [Mangrovicoccus ximenensis]|uniref:M35 family metallo-endopeptidase n=1 Tax=Mangrovicoccus ximenensis TaxID=1911570 RepID=UPI000D3D9B20|nr:M35 family metallo-endopeptidase [Mangrovicoccus ximenensis]
MTFVNRAGGVLRVECNSDNLYQNQLMPVGQSETLVDPDGSGAIAHAFPADRHHADPGPKRTVSHVGSGMRICLTDLFFGLDADNQSATVHHELPHKVLATNDPAHGVVACRRLSTDPARAIRNADSDAMFAPNC